ncbi:MAG: outer membrane lipoprotein carrier protein LolA [Micavibrio aeruginosavorus]|uniref:Outer membrane lipoprotein carrier protein LolA n=1 Tax=Micavibrio aeruginosavorus TaxID=349221 RepID=A0A2W5FMW5_9BACT|nr:MAG: outer membrane lipoprotein carrier protein LolA [Micavibrio aeruginosavorus]
MKKIILTLALLLISAPAFADNAADIAKAENYFKTLTTAKSRFVQTAPDGKQTRGNFYLSRPGKLRFEYDAPIKDFVVADGLFIYFYDDQLKQQSNAPISQTLADFLLRKNLKLSGDLKVTQIKRDGGLMQMTMVQAAEPNAGSLTLGFQETPNLQLKKWQVRDATGNITEIELFNVQTNMNLPSKLFVYLDPNKKGYN